MPSSAPASSGYSAATFFSADDSTGVSSRLARCPSRRSSRSLAADSRMCASAQKDTLSPCIMFSLLPLMGQRSVCTALSSSTPSRTRHKNARS